LNDRGFISPATVFLLPLGVSWVPTGGTILFRDIGALHDARPTDEV
jgi:hypothetical protein